MTLRQPTMKFMLAAAAILLGGNLRAETRDARPLPPWASATSLGFNLSEVSGDLSSASR